jgi:hypothetical protein
MLVNPYDYFLTGDRYLLNKLFNDFPSFDPENFSEFILNDSNHIRYINYYLHTIYPMMCKSNDPKVNQSKETLKVLLNSISMDALICLWQEKFSHFSVWYSNAKEIHSYLSLLKPDTIINTIIYLYYIEKSDSKAKIYYPQSIKLASALLVYLEEEHFNTIAGHEYFLDIYSNFSEQFSEEEFSALLNLKPSLINFIKANKETSEIHYITTLEQSDRADIESVINLIQSEYELAENQFNKKIQFQSKDFTLKNGLIKMKLDSLVEYIKIFSEISRPKFFNEFINTEIAKKTLSQNDIDLVFALIKKDFKFQ